MTTPAQVKLTLDQYFALPETTLPRHFIDGEVIELPAPDTDHQRVVVRLIGLFLKIIANRGGEVFTSPYDVVLGGNFVVQPDILWFTDDNPHKPPQGSKRMMGAPDIVVEVFSPSTAQFDRHKKFDLYDDYGVQEYWQVDPRDRLIELWLRKDNRLQRQGVYIPGEQFTSTLVGDVHVNDILGEPPV